MIFPCSNIFVVYSTAVKDMFNKVIRVINEAYQNENIAVKAIYIDDDILNNATGENLRRVIEERIRLADAAIVLYTPDDVYVRQSNLTLSLLNVIEHGMQEKLIFSPRQNVIFELGMLFSSLPSNRIYILMNPKADLFSDIKGIVFHEIGDDIEKSTGEILRNFGRIDIQPLENTSYAPGYFRDIKKYSGSYEDLGDVFIRELDVLDNLEQKIVYIAERMLFTRIIRLKTKEILKILDNYLAELDSTLYTPDQKKKIIVSANILKLVCNYLLLRHEHRHAIDLHSNEINQSQEYYSLNNEWENVIKELESMEINPLIPLLCYDYAGLTIHKIITFDMQSDNTNTKYKEIYRKIKIAKQYYKKSLNCIDHFQLDDNSFWKGYVTFDQARMLFCEYNLKKKFNQPALSVKEECLEKTNECIEIRRDWYKKTREYLPKSVVIQFQCEYFYALPYYFEALQELRPGDFERIKQGCLARYNDWINANNDMIDDLINHVANRLKGY